MMVVFVFILGLFVGSFLNVVVHRLHRHESFVLGYSKCLFCGHRLYPLDLVPLFSYLFLRGRCRYCQHGFSGHYPLIELITGLTFSLIFWRLIPDTSVLSIFFISAVSLAKVFFWWVISAFLIIVFTYDLKFYIILDKVVIPAMVIALLGNLALGHSIGNLLFGALIGGLFFLLQYIISQGRWIGDGDIRLGFLMGLILGWPQILVALFLAYVLGSVVGVGLLLSSKKKWKDKLPFGTFLSMATIICLLFGEQILNWYLNLLYIN